MTAEVAILNNIGVAMAADSAVTIGRNAEKIYTSSDKLFNLVPNAPVAVMIYGNANFLGIPLETVIKEYRQQIGTGGFDTLQQYFRDFLRWIGRNRRMFPESTQLLYQDTLIRHFHKSIRRELVNQLSSSGKYSEETTKKELVSSIVVFLENRLRRIQELPIVKGFGKTTVDALRSQYRREATSIVDSTFGPLLLDKSCLQLLEDLTIEMLSRECFGPMASGIVVAGFGGQEFLPSLYTCRVEGVIRNRLRIGEQDQRAITHDNSACVVPFAEQEMVYSFLNGIDPTFQSYIDEKFTNTLKGVAEVVTETFADTQNSEHVKYRSRMDTALTKLIDEVKDDLYRRREQYWSPVITNVAVLPEDELASMAKALVELTKFRRRVSQDPETVGGPVDVAVITKGDGFVWVNRKHYFDGALNPRTMSRYWTDG